MARQEGHGASGSALPLGPGATGAAVADVQRRLESLGLGPLTDPPGSYGPATRAAVEAFQHRRGLRVDGICGPETWGTLVEAGLRLGDRFLYRRNPSLRGDDVANLQQLLSALGFDTGRVDGIFGDNTARALREFQQNAGLPVDGICGAETLQSLRRLRTPHVAANLVSTVRAREHLRRPHGGLEGARIGVGERGGLAPLLGALRRRLVGAGARVAAFHHPDGSVQAQLANNAKVDVFVGLRLEPDSPGCSTSYYSGYRDESPGGKRLAELVQARVPERLGVPDRGTTGMSVPILRETAMPAVIVEVGPARPVVEGGPAVADALTEALGTWTTSGWE